MKCPFCQQELDMDMCGECGCINEQCQKSVFMFGSEELWQELIRTRKALETIKKELDIRKKQVEIANKAFDFINTEWDNVDCSRKELGACAFNTKEDIAGWESDIETALEQKDVK